MGCILSKFGLDDPVGRCKARKSLMKQVVQHRYSFSQAHSAYLTSLRDTGAALRQFSEGEGGVPATGLGPYAIEPRPPPPLPPCLHPQEEPPFGVWGFPEESGNLPEEPSVSVSGDSSLGKIEEVKSHADGSIQLNELKKESPNGVDAVVPRAVEEEVEGDLDLEISLSLKRPVNKNLAEIMKELDEEFLKASFGDSMEVTQILEARKPEVESHPPKGGKYRKYRSARVFNTLSWNWSRNSFSSSKEIERNVDASGRTISHSWTLERLLACEKKLLEEVKVVESLRVEREKKCSILRHQETRGEDGAEIEKTRIEIKRLHSLIVISSQVVDSTIEAIEDLRDDDLHPQLVSLVDGLMHMWVTMHRCHARQTQIIIHIKSLDAMMSHEPTSEAHHEATLQLQRELLNWHENFQKLVTSQRAYMAALHGWLKLSLVPVLASKQKKKAMEDGEDEEGGFLLLRLCEEWHRALSCLPDRVAGEAIKSLAEVVKGMVGKQGEEIKQRKKVERMEKQWEKKTRALEPLEDQEEANNRCPRRKDDEAEDIDGDRECDDDEDDEKQSKASFMIMPIGLMERRAAVAGIKKKLEAEMAKLCKAVQDTRVFTMNNLQTGLPGVLEAMTGFSSVCSQSYQHLHSLSRFSNSH